jgi:hypothetical protein
MTTRRAFLASGAGLLAGLSTTPCTGTTADSGPASPRRLAVIAETNRVQRELRVFEQEYLPVLLAPRALRFPDGVPVAVYRSSRYGAALLHKWRAAIQLLARTLPGPDGRVAVPDARVEEFRTLHARLSPGRDDRTGTLDRPCYTLAGDGAGIQWHIHLSTDFLPPERVAREILRWSLGREAEPEQRQAELRRQLPRIRQQYLAAAGDFNWLSRTYTNWLPLLGGLDPLFALSALDFRRLSQAATGGRPVSQDLGRFLCSCVSCGLASLMVVLANNHFPVIRRVLRRAEVYGDWGMFMPAFLSAVLAHKVMSLRDLAEVAG